MATAAADSDVEAEASSVEEAHRAGAVRSEGVATDPVFAVAEGKVAAVVAVAGWAEAATAVGSRAGAAARREAATAAAARAAAAAAAEARATSRCGTRGSTCMSR
jgi:hypothetical protein